MQAYAIWNNKGGTGKSTITFHIACRFAEAHPERTVLIVDLCPQANSSMLLLGGGVDGEERLLALCSKEKPKSVVGYISDALVSASGTPDINEYIVRVYDYNEKVPSNLYLLCGDGNLELLAAAITEEANRRPLLSRQDPWAWAHEIFTRLIKEVAQEHCTIFYDTNPSFGIYTELAVCGATRLLVPVNADDSSRVAVRALFALLYGTNPPHQFFGNYTFAKRAAERGMQMPQLHLAIGNRFTQYKGAAAAFAAFSQATADQLFAEYQANPERFSARYFPPENLEDFLASYVGQLRDFNTAGVVAAHTGTPMSRMKQDYFPVHDNPNVKVTKAQLVAGLEAVDSVVAKLDP